MRFNSPKIYVNADDFGIDERNSRIIINFLKRGYCDTTTVMVNMDGFVDTALIASQSEVLSAVGLHLNLTEGTPITKSISENTVFCQRGKFGNYKRHISSRIFMCRYLKTIVRDELKAQIERYLQLGYTGMTMDSHQGIHMDLSLYPIVIDLFQEYGFRRLRRSPNLNNSTANRKVKAILRKPFDRAVIVNKISTTSYMGNLKDLQESNISFSVDTTVEIMTHPSERDGVLFLDWCSGLKLNDGLLTLRRRSSIF